MDAFETSSACVLFQIYGNDIKLSCNRKYCVNFWHGSIFSPHTTTICIEQESQCDLEIKKKISRGKMRFKEKEQNVEYAFSYNKIASHEFLSLYQIVAVRDFSSPQELNNVVYEPNPKYMYDLSIERTIDRAYFLSMLSKQCTFVCFTYAIVSLVICVWVCERASNTILNVIVVVIEWERKNDGNTWILRRVYSK